MSQHDALVGWPSFLRALPVVVEHALTVSNPPNVVSFRALG